MLEALHAVRSKPLSGGSFSDFGSIVLGPNTYADGVYTFSGTERAYFSKPGVPSGMAIRANTDFHIEMDVMATTTTGYQNLFGDLVDRTGEGTYWVAINNTYQVAAMLVLDCLGSGLNYTNTKRFRFGIGATKFPLNVATKVIIKRVNGIISASINGVQFPETYVDNSGYAPVTTAPFAIGGSSDNMYLFKGTISNIRIEM